MGSSPHLGSGTFHCVA